MNSGDRRFSVSLPAPVRSAIYANYPVYRAIITIIDRLSELHDLQMIAQLSSTPEQARTYPVLDFTIDDGRLFLFRISCPDRIFFRFSTRTDLNRFLEMAKPEAVLSGSELSANPKGWPIYFEMMAAFRATDVDYSLFADVLVDVLERSPTRRTVRQAGDSELQALLREINKPQDEYVFDDIIERILDRIDEDNLVDVMGSLAAYDPYAEEDTSSVPGMKLILMNDLVRERDRLLEQCRALLPSVRLEFEAIGARATSDLAELDALISYIDKKLS